MEEKRYLKRKAKALNENNRYNLAIACNYLADYYNQQGKYKHAASEYLQEAEIYGKLGKRLEMAKANRMVGEMFMLLCDFDEARKHIDIYLNTVKVLQNKVEEQRAYATLGRAHLLHGQSTDITAAESLEQLKKAEKSFLRSLLLTKELSGQISKLEQLDMQARCFLNIGVVKEHMGSYEESIANFEKAINICVGHDIFELTHQCYVSMSLMYHCKKNDATLALRYCNMALEVAKRLPNKVKKICETLIIKSEILLKGGDFASAKQILTKAYKKNTPDENDRNNIEKSLRVVVKICEILDELVTTSSIDYGKRKILFEKLGDGCCQLMIYGQALEYYLKTLECAQLNGESEKALVPIYVSLYQTYKDNKDYEKALEYLWKEFEVNKDEPAEAFSTLCGIADVYELQMQTFWNVQEIYLRAKDQTEKVSELLRPKLEKIIYSRLIKLMEKHKMNTMAELLREEMKSKGIDPKIIDEDDGDSDSEVLNWDQNTPELGDDICLDDLVDSDTSDLDETEKPRPHRMTRGTRTLTIKRNNKGETQLHQACIAGNLELARGLIDQGHVVNVRDHAGWLPLHEACNHGFYNIVELLLDKGAAMAINDKGGTSCDGITPLYDACSNGYLDVAELLLERGADATVRTDYGETCVDGLDKWRRTATLTDGEQAQYARVREMLLRPLAKVNVGNWINPLPLTNAHVNVDDNTSQENSDSSDVENISQQSKECRNGELEKFNKKQESQKSCKNRASWEYRQAIEHLKHPNRQAPVDKEKPSDCVASTSLSLSSKQKRGALLTSDEVDDDDWLIDDIGPEKKKRRYVTSPTSGNRLSTTSRQSRDTVSPGWGNNFTIDTENDAFQVLLDASSGKKSLQRSGSKQKNKLRLSRTSSIGSNSSRSKYQSSLLDSGFCRFRSESPMSGEDSNEAPLPAATPGSRYEAFAEPDSTTSTKQQVVVSPPQVAALKVTSVPAITPIVSFKVKVEDELLLVPVEQTKLCDINMRWLAEEAARRYYNLVGLKPILRLKTIDGFVYEENDPVSVALEQSMIMATAMEWEVNPISKKYEELCHKSGMDVDNGILLPMQRSEESHILKLGQKWLEAPITKPIFKSLMHQTHLRELDISKNFIQSGECKLLAKSLATLKHLKVLDISSNFIQEAGIEKLFGGANINALPDLEEFNLGNNPLNNNVLPLLDAFLSTKTQLKKLNLKKCCLTDMMNCDLRFNQLVEFDISFNSLMDDSLRQMLSKLNINRLEYIGFNYVQRGRCRRDLNIFIDFFESGICSKLKEVRLCGNNMIDMQVKRIVQSLTNATELVKLDISDNMQLRSHTVPFIIGKLPQLQKLSVANCPLTMDVEVVDQLAKLKRVPSFLLVFIAPTDDHHLYIAHTLPAIWKAVWGTRAHTVTLGVNMLLDIDDV